MAEKMVRMSFTVPPSFRENLKFVSESIGISQSAVVSQMLGESLGEFANLCNEADLDYSVPDDVRYRNSSIEIIERRIATVHEIFGRGKLR